jgi:hypothetical protein
MEGKSCISFAFVLSYIAINFSSTPSLGSTQRSFQRMCRAVLTQIKTA